MHTISNGTAWKGRPHPTADLTAQAIRDLKGFYLDAMNGDQKAARTLDTLSLKIADRLDAEGQDGLAFLARCRA